MTTAYFFRIGQGSDGWASYLQAMTKQLTRDLDEEVAAMMAGNFSGWVDDVSIVHLDSGDLNIDFTSEVSAQLIFQILNPDIGNATYFAKNSPLETLKIKGLDRSKVFWSTNTYPASDNQPLWASAEINLAETRKDICKYYPNAEAGGHKITRFPFTFNFIENSSDVSPFIRSDHHDVSSDQEHDHDKISLMVHGGIHPRDPSNCVCSDGG